MVRFIIGLAGIKYSGKDTVGGWLMSRYGFKRYAFGDCVKDVCRSVFGFSEEQLNGAFKEVKDEYWLVEPRRVMQYVGTELFRDGIGGCKGLEWIGCDLWVNVVRRKIMSAGADELVVVTDVRFDNEAKMIRDLGGIVVGVRRMDGNVEVGVGNDHSSESQDFRVDYEISNNGTLDELYGKIDEFMAVVNLGCILH